MEPEESSPGFVSNEQHAPDDMLTTNQPYAVLFSHPAKSLDAFGVQALSFARKLIRDGFRVFTERRDSVWRVEYFLEKGCIDQHRDDPVLWGTEYLQAVQRRLLFLRLRLS